MRIQVKEQNSRVMLFKSQLHKNFFANWLIFLSLTVFTLTALYSELFQSTATKKDDDAHRRLFSTSDFKGLTSLRIENKLVSFDIIKQKQSFGERWMMFSPNELPINEEAIENIVSSLLEMKIVRIFPKEPLHLANFSLNRPSLTIDLLTSTDQKTTIHFGLENNHDRTTYISLSDRDFIYQIEAHPFPPESFSLARLIDNRVVSLSPDKITALRIYRGAIKDGKNIFSITRKENESETWVALSPEQSNSWGRRLVPSEQKTYLESKKVHEFLLGLSQMKGKLIWDRAEKKELESTIKKLLATPFYTFVITNDEGEDIWYETSSILTSTSHRDHILVRNSENDFPYLVRQDFLEILKTDQDSMKTLPFHKIFY